MNLKQKLNASGITAVILISGILAFVGICNVGLTGCVTPSSPTDPNVTFAQTVQNIVQTVNSGLKIVGPFVTDAATAAKLVVHTPEQQAILDKIISISSTVSAATAATGAPPTVIQAAVSAVNTPETAQAIVQQVEASNPSTSMLKVTPFPKDIRPPHGSVKRESAYDLSVIGDSKPKTMVASEGEFYIY